MTGDELLAQVKALPVQEQLTFARELIAALNDMNRILDETADDLTANIDDEWEHMNRD